MADEAKSLPRRCDSSDSLYGEDERTAELIPWRTTRPHEGETVRWECVDGRWITLSLGHGASHGTVLVSDSAGRCESVDSYQRALELAKRWRR